MEYVLDVRGLPCPGPVARTGELLRRLEHGVEITVLTDDPWAVIDLRAFCDVNRHEYIGQEERDGLVRFRLRKKPGESV